MADNEQDNVDRPFHREGDAFVLHAPVDPKETARQRREDEQHEFARSQVKTNKRIAWFNGLLVIATFATIGVGIWQGSISQRSANAAKDAVTVAAQSRKDAKISSDAAAESSGKSLQATIDNFHQEQRAWLAVEDVHGPIEQPITQFTNTGRTPAINTVIYGHTSYLPEGQELNFRVHYDGLRLGILSPGTHRTSNATHVTVDMSHGGSIYSYGLITYEDIFHQAHWITFCAKVNQDRTGYEFCPNKNDADDGNYPKP